MKRTLIPLALAVLAVAELPAQTTSAAPVEPSATASDEPAVELSPFEVNAEADEGYVGQNTLAGSRLRTNLKDLGVAISPMTAEFLQDIAATNIIEAMEYGVSARAETDDGRAAGPVNDGYNNSIREIRVRGLPGGSRMVNYFRRLGEVDMFNTERLDLARGPNSILYGFGSAAGVINAGTKQARLNRNSRSLELRVDSWGGYRATLDANVAVIPEKLGVRVAVLHGEERSWRSYGHNNQDRFYLTAKWQIDRKTTFTAALEAGTMDRFVPRPLFGIDLMSPWISAGEPSFTNFDPSLPPTASAGVPGKPFRDSGARQVNGVQEIGGGDHVVVSSAFPHAQNYRMFTRSERPSGLSRADFVMGRINPKAALDANNWWGIWDNKGVDLSLQRELFRNVHAELAYNQQSFDWETQNVNWELQGVQADPNLYLPNGEIKPVENRYYFEHYDMRRMEDLGIRQGRLALSWEPSLGKLGRLRLAALAELSLLERRFMNMEQKWMNSPDLTSGGVFHPSPENAANRVWQRHYISSLDELNDPKFTIPKSYDLSQPVQYQDPASGNLRTISPNWVNSGAGNYSDEDLWSWALGGQWYLLKDRLVLTGGMRESNLKFFRKPGIRDPEGEAKLVNSGMWLPQDPGGLLNSETDGRTYSIGGVFHVTPWLAAFYNTSTSEAVPGSLFLFNEDPAALDQGVTAPVRKGVTEDFGLKLSLLKDKLYVTATFFTTEAKNDAGFSQFQQPPDARLIWSALRDSGLLSPDMQTVAQEHALMRTNGYLFDSKSKGQELEIVGSIVPGWSVSVNFSNIEAIRSSMAPRTRAYFEHWKPFWLQETYRGLQIPQNTSVAGPEYRPHEDFRTPAEIAATGDFTINTDTINERIVDTENFFYDRLFTFEGQRYIGDNKINVNLRTRYDFRSSWLKGFSIGAGMRTRTGRVAGAEVDYEFIDGSSYTDANNGRKVNEVTLVNAVDQEIFDLQLTYVRPFTWGDRKFNWRVQLNVNNLLDEDEFIINNLAPVTLEPTAYRYQDPRQFILTNTISF